MQRDLCNLHNLILHSHKGRGTPRDNKGQEFAPFENSFLHSALPPKQFLPESRDSISNLDIGTKNDPQKHFRQNISFVFNFF